MFLLHPHYSVKPDQIPRALYISIDDLNALIHKYQNTKEGTLDGIRVYFGLVKGENTKKTLYHIRGSIVPVIKIKEKRVDMINKNPEDTSIYDFTTPCPRTCDFDSELYIPIDIQ